jgi:hypothetical protein
MHSSSDVPVLVGVCVSIDDGDRTWYGTMNTGMDYIQSGASNQHTLRLSTVLRDICVGLTRDFQTVGYVHVGNEVFIRAGAY